MNKVTIEIKDQEADEGLVCITEVKFEPEMDADVDLSTLTGSQILGLALVQYMAKMENSTIVPPSDERH
jgi:hypothetical protein